MNKLIILDDDQVFRQRLARAFRVRNFEVAETGTLKDLSEIINSSEFNYAILDLMLGNEFNNCESGLNALKIILNANQKCKVIMLTGFGTIATAVEAVKLGAVNYLTKPAEIEDVLKAFGNPQKDLDLLSESKSNIPNLPSLAQNEWEHIQSVLKFCSGNITQAAKQLGLHRRSLQRKLTKIPCDLK